MMGRGMLTARCITAAGYCLILSSLYAAAGGIDAFSLTFHAAAVPLTVLGLLAVTADSHVQMSFFENVPAVYRVAIKTSFFGFMIIVFLAATRSVPASLFLGFILTLAGDIHRGWVLVRTAYAGFLFLMFTGESTDPAMLLRLNWLFFPGILCMLSGFHLVFEKKGRIETGVKTTVETILTVAVFTSVPAFGAWGASEMFSGYLYSVRRKNLNIETIPFEHHRFDFGFVFDAVILMVLIGLMIFLYRRIRSRSDAQKTLDDEGVLPLFASSRPLRLRSKRTGFSGPAANLKIIRLYYSFLDLMAAQGFSLRGQATPLEVAEELAEKGVVPARGVRDFTMSYLKARFSGRELGGEDVKTADRSFGLLRERVLSGR